ncbi:NR1H4-like protein [Mya arenaria]|uniref:NR1H4-like protein n=1 Tax=Mya arenaria TaxID=6604 RepID=A0ABY7F7C0_MYAAR|nr:NR1H4-like protein [Mya arenaria]
MSTKGQKAKTHYTTVEMAHCRVCGRKSSGYHFGVVSCEACKNSRISTVCRKGNNRCYGDVRSISDCSACRLNKCKDLGMSKRMPIDLSVRSPHVDVEDLEVCETIQRLVNLQDSLYPHAANDPSVLLELAIIEEEHRQREEVFKMMFALRKKGIENEKNIVKYIQHSKHIPGFDTLELDDILNLLKDSYFEFWLFSNHAYFNDQVSGGSDAVVQAHKKVIMSLFPKDYVESVFKFAESLRSLELTLEEVAIIRGIILTFTDRQKLNHSHAVEKLQEKYVECLIHHLSTTRDQYLSRFCRIIDRLTEVRSLTYRNSFVNSQVLSDWPFIAKEFPLWKEIMSTHKD